MQHGEKKEKRGRRASPCGSESMLRHGEHQLGSLKESMRSDPVYVAQPLLNSFLLASFLSATQRAPTTCAKGRQEKKPKPT